MEGYGERSVCLTDRPGGYREPTPQATAPGRREADIGVSQDREGCHEEHKVKLLPRRFCQYMVFDTALISTGSSVDLRSNPEPSSIRDVAGQIPPVAGWTNSNNIFQVSRGVTCDSCAAFWTTEAVLVEK